MITGSQHEHLPLAMMTIWPWSAAATAFALMTPAGRSLRDWTAGVVALWSGVFLAGVFAPVMVTGTDPTKIPLAVVIVPPVAAMITGLMSLHQANQVAQDALSSQAAR
jgi:peptidoglycan/LPS O-acetylase OafA/YrhL